MYDSEYLGTLSHGEDRLDYYKKCIAEADAEKDHHSMIWLRHDYIQESVFHDDNFKAVIMFPEFMKLFDEYPGEMKPSSFMFPFKWLLSNCDDYYQISRGQIDSFFERFKIYIEKFGYTLRTYYSLMYSAYYDIDRELALRSFEESRKYERTEMSDCIACEAAEDAVYELSNGSPKKAVEMLNDMIERNMKCANVPRGTYGRFAHEFALRGMYGEAEHYASLMLPMIKGDEKTFLKRIAHIIEFKCFTDPNGAFELFCRCAGHFSTTKNPCSRYCFARAAHRFFARLAEMGEEEIFMRLTSEFEFFSEDNRYNTAELRDKFYAAAVDLAEKFDKRNGTRYYAEALEFVYPDAPEKAIELPVHGSIPPESPVIGLLMRSEQDIPFADPDEFERILAEKCGITNIGFASDEEEHRIYVSGSMEDGSKVRYAFSLHDAPDPETMKQIQWAAEGELDSLSEYEAMAAIYSMIPCDDRFEELSRLLKIAAAVDRSDSPVIYDLTNSRMLSKKWLSLEAAGETFPFARYYTRTWVYRSAFEEECVDLATSGLATFGSRELLVPALGEDDLDFAAGVLNNIIEAASISPLPDEGVTRNSGIVYDSKAFIRFTWRPITVPDDGAEDEREEQEQKEVFAEPILYLSAADQAEGRGYSIGEIPAEEREKFDFRTHSLFTTNEERKCRERFPQVLEYFRTHDCNVFISSYYSPLNEDDDEDECFYHGMLERVGEEVKIRVTGITDSAECAVHEDDIIDTDPDSIFFVRIDLDGGNDRYYVDEFFILLSES